MEISECKTGLEKLNSKIASFENTCRSTANTGSIPPFATPMEATDASELIKFLDENYIFDSSVTSKISWGDVVSKTIADVMRLCQSQGSINISQNVDCPYFFWFKSDTTIKLVSLLYARLLLKVLKSQKMKIHIDKVNRNFKNPIAANFMDLMCSATYVPANDANDSLFKRILKYALRIKVSVNPWTNETVQLPEVKPIEDTNSRFSGAEWFEKAEQDITLIGCGGLGSWIAASLCRVMGSRELNLYDPDAVEHVNLAGQHFSLKDIGKYKADVIGDQCCEFNPAINVNWYIERFTSDSELRDAANVICGLDNMASRYVVWNSWKKSIHPNRKSVLIDCRLSAEMWQVFTISSDDEIAQKEYESKWLFPDNEAESDVCSYKQTAFAAQMCSSYAVNTYINWCANLGKEHNDPLRRRVPFMIEYDASQILLRITDL